MANLKLLISPAPHLHSVEHTRRLMRDVLLALAPAVLVSLYFSGWNGLMVFLVSVLACVGIEYGIQRFMMKGASTIGDLSALLTGVLLALNLPPSAPLWLVLIGAAVAIGIAKMTFGGLGKNLFNPALVARVVLLISFPIQMTNWAISGWGSGMIVKNLGDLDAVSSSTILGTIKTGLANGLTMDQLHSIYNLSYFEMLFGKIGGSMGEISALALLLGFGYLLVRKVIKWHIPVSILLTVAVFTGILYLSDPLHNADPLFHLLTGGLLLGAIFMATDYVSSPMNTLGMWVYGIGIGVITVLIRVYGSYPEGISFAILIMNATVPLINMFCKSKRFGKEAVNV